MTMSGWSMENCWVVGKEGGRKERTDICVWSMDIMTRGLTRDNVWLVYGELLLG